MRTFLKSVSNLHATVRRQGALVKVTDTVTFGYSDKQWEQK